MKKTLKSAIFPYLAIMSMVCLLPLSGRAWEPNAAELDAALANGDFGAYHAKISAWLDQKTPAAPGGITLEAMIPLIEDPVFRNALNQRQFIHKHGVSNLTAFVAVPANKEFLVWILKNTAIMDLYLEAAAPTRDRHRELNAYTIGIGALERWKRLYTEHPDSREGVCLKLAMATALWPPNGMGGKSYGSGLPVEWMGRYEHYQAAYKNKELFPSFDNLLVWDYGKVIDSWASDAELAWGREMVNTWRPDLREKEQIPMIVSEVWRRFSPFPFSEGFPTVLAGGGKCGPRAFFGRFICQAFGIPAIGIGQPAHACFAAKMAHPELEPQPGSVWKVYQGRGWHVSDVGDAMWGPEFLSETAKRYSVTEFSRVEHLRWLASALTPEARSAAVLEAARGIWNAVPPINEELRAQERSPLAVPLDAKPDETAMCPRPPYESAPGVLRIDAEAFLKGEGVLVHDCFTGGKQIHLPRTGDNYGTPPVVDYIVEIPKAGVYGLTMQIAAANKEQFILLGVETNEPIKVELPWTRGLWGTTEEVELRLEKGVHSLKLTRPGAHRGVTVRWLELKAK